MNFGWFELVDRESGTNWTQILMSHDAHCSCKPPAPLQHRNEPIFASYATVCVFGPCNVSPPYMYTRIEDACVHNMPPWFVPTFNHLPLRSGYWFESLQTLLSFRQKNMFMRLPVRVIEYGRLFNLKAQLTIKLGDLWYLRKPFWGYCRKQMGYLRDQNWKGCLKGLMSWENNRDILLIKRQQVLAFIEHNYSMEQNR